MKASLISGLARVDRESSYSSALAMVVRWLPRLRYSHWDALLISLALIHGVLLFSFPSMLLIAVGVWWNSNTIAHQFLHLPFFEQKFWNRCFALYESLLLGIPQRLWRDRHLAHHAERPWKFRKSPQLILEITLLAILWGILSLKAPEFLLKVYGPGFLLGLGLCQLQGFYEHARGTTSHYGWLYNYFFFNDGFHVEHHESPGIHWRELPKKRLHMASASRWPAVLRWIEVFNLDRLERIVLRIKPLQQWLLACHERAFRRLLPDNSTIKTIGIVGGGLFPRTPLILRKLFPNAEITVFEQEMDHIKIAEQFDVPAIEFIHARFDGGTDRAFDLLVIPLAFHGKIEELLENPSAPRILVHDWIWRPGSNSTIVSWILLKRLIRYNL